MSDLGPRILSTIPDGPDLGNRYITLGDDWGSAMIMSDLDQVIVHVSLVIGYEAQIRFFKDGVPSPPLPLFTGVNAWTEQRDYRYDKVEFKNAHVGQPAQIIAFVQGV